MSKYFYQKLSNRLDDSTILEGFDTLLSVATCPSSFNSIEELQEYITEGALLNVNVLGSKALSIPCGEYQVWLTDAGHTMLVPTLSGTSNDGVFEHKAESFEISTKDMLKTFHGFGKTLAENYSPVFEADDEEPDDEKEDMSKFQLSIDKQTVDRMPLLKAMEEKQMTVTELAELCGVDPPAISRILRQPEPGPGDPGGRNPSMPLAAKICAALSMDPKSAFPDIFHKKATKKDEN